jgi:hypothetical protein
VDRSPFEFTRTLPEQTPTAGGLVKFGTYVRDSTGQA